MIIKVNLRHYKDSDTSPISRTIVSVNGVDLFDIATHASRLKFIPKRQNPAGKSVVNEYYLIVNDNDWNPLPND